MNPGRNRTRKQNTPGKRWPFLFDGRRDGRPSSFKALSRPGQHIVSVPGLGNSFSPTMTIEEDVRCFKSARGYRSSKVQ